MPGAGKRRTALKIQRIRHHRCAVSRPPLVSRERHTLQRGESHRHSGNLSARTAGVLGIWANILACFI